MRHFFHLGFGSTRRFLVSFSYIFFFQTFNLVCKICIYTLRRHTYVYVYARFYGVVLKQIHYVQMHVREEATSFKHMCLIKLCCSIVVGRVFRPWGKLNIVQFSVHLVANIEISTDLRANRSVGVCSTSSKAK